MVYSTGSILSVFPRKTSKTQSSLNFLQSRPRKFTKSDFSGLAPIQRVLSSKMHANFFLRTNFLNTPGVRTAAGTIPGTSQIPLSETAKPGLGNPGFHKLQPPPSPKPPPFPPCKTCPADLSTILCTSMHSHTGNGEVFGGLGGFFWVAIYENLGFPISKPGVSQSPTLFETQGRHTFEGGHELFGHHPFAWKTPTPPDGLRTQKVNLCALLS